MKRVVIGARGGADIGLWISKPGKDAGSTNDDDMLVSPSRFLVQPFMQGRIYAPANASGNSDTKVALTITHNLGYIPVAEVFGKGSGAGGAPFFVVTTTQIRINNADDNSFHYTGQGAPSGTYYYPEDFVYVIFRTQLAPS